MPHIHDEDEAVAVGLLPDLVLEGVVEDEDFTFLPLPVTQKMTKNEEETLRKQKEIFVVMTLFVRATIKVQITVSD